MHTKLFFVQNCVCRNAAFLRTSKTPFNLYYNQHKNESSFSYMEQSIEKITKTLIFPQSCEEKKVRKK
jgi:hypothetical protein